MLQPSISEARALDDYRIYLEYVTGEKKIFDAKPFLAQTVYRSLKDLSIFATAHPVDNGWTVEFDNGYDLSPDALYWDSVPLAG